MECLPRTGRGGCPRLQRRGCAGGRDARGRAIGRQNSLGEVGATPGSFNPSGMYDSPDPQNMQFLMDFHVLNNRIVLLIFEVI